MKRELDYIDLHIISLLQENARLPLKEIAARIFLSSPATAARMDKLESQGYITGFHASINRKKMGYPIKAFITLSLGASMHIDAKGGMHKNSREELISYLQQCKNLVECNCITGDYALLLEVVHRNTEELEQFIRKLQKYGKTETQIVCSTAVEHRELLTDLNVEKAG